jgi:hypothetical protein
MSEKMVIMHYLFFYPEVDAKTRRKFSVVTSFQNVLLTNVTMFCAVVDEIIMSRC